MSKKTFGFLDQGQYDGEYGLIDDLDVEVTGRQVERREGLVTWKIGGLLACLGSALLVIALIVAGAIKAYGSEAPSKQPKVGSIEPATVIVETGKDDSGKTIMHAEDANVPVPEGGKLLVCFRSDDQMLCFYENTTTHEVVGIPLKKETT